MKITSFLTLAVAAALGWSAAAWAIGSVKTIAVADVNSASVRYVRHVVRAAAAPQMRTLWASIQDARD